MMRIILTDPLKGLLIVALMLPGSAGFAEDRVVVPPDEFVYCTVCHGVQLKGNAVIGAPRLSGMAEWYVIRQLQAFKSNRRGVHKDDLFGMEMRPMASMLTEVQIKQAASYVNAVASESPPVTIGGNVQRGKRLYAACAACHGKDGQGVEALGGPALADLNDWYLIRQLENFRDGTRGGSSGEDTYGAQMRAAAQILEDDDAIRDVVAYISSLHSQ